MGKQIGKAKTSKVVSKELLKEPTESAFTLKGKLYRVVKQADDIKVYLGNKLVFDKFNSKRSFIEWIKINK